MTSPYHFRTHQGLFLFVFKLLDAVAMLLCAAFAHHQVGSGWPTDTASEATILLAVLAFTMIADKTALYQPWRGKRLRREIGLLIMCVVLSIGFVAFVAEIYAFFGAGDLFYVWMFIWLLATVCAMVTIRLIVRPALAMLRSRGANQRRILVVGMNAKTSEFIDSLRTHPEYGFRFVGYVDDRSTLREDEASVLAYLGPTSELESLCIEHEVDQIWFGYPLDASCRLSTVMDTLKHYPVGMRQVMNLVATPPFCNSITGVMGTPVLDIDVNFTDDQFGHFVKAVQDKVVAGLALALLSPLMALIAVAVKLSSPGPVLYRQTRLTWRNRPFEILKFRSMPVDVESRSGPKWAQAGERRATRIGAFLRATSLDELPQLWNVLKGDMSIVGPRPERPEFVDKFKHEIPNYMKKHRVKAGITGWAQVNGLRGDTDLGKRIDYDLYYIRNGSLRFDLWIIFLTFFKGFVNRNAY